jgi:hypothetical protein
LVDELMKAVTRLLFTACMLLFIQECLAHAFIDRAEPAVGSQIQVSPAQVKIWFTEREVKIDHSNAALLTVSLPELKPGKYKVVWRVVSVDTHTTMGNFEFEVKP